jgi:hypothetical protein
MKLDMKQKNSTTEKAEKEEGSQKVAATRSETTVQSEATSVT